MLLKKVKIVVCMMISMMAVLLINCNNIQEYQSSSIGMGTIIQVKIWGSKDITDEVNMTISEIEEKMLSSKLSESELYQVNSGAGKIEGVEVSDKLYNYLLELNEVAQKSQGALDISLGPIIELWNFDNQVAIENPQMPTTKEIQDTLVSVGYEKIQYESNRIILEENMSLYLGAVGKGIASDEILDVLKETAGVSGAILSIGGCVVTYGEKLDGSPFSIAIKNPLEEAESSIGTLVLSGEWVISTSGNYERYFEIDGKVYHHILDPKTGYPVDNNVASVTIVSKNGLLSDALSTACFVLGVEEGLKLIDEFDAEALFVTKNGEILMSDGMKAYFRE